MIAISPQSRLLGMPIIAWIGVVLGIASTGACLFFAGPTLGVFFGGIVMAALLVPTLCLAEEGLLDRLIIAGGVCDGVAMIWLIAMFMSPVTLVQWLLCYAILIAWCAALVGLSGLFEMLFPHVPAAAIVTVVALLWLASPVWSARTLPDHPQLVEWFTPLHPLMCMNGVVKNLGTWTERPIAYRYLLTLGQDVPYELPRSILPMVLFHLLVGGASLGTLCIGKRCTLRSTTQTDNSASTPMTQ